MSLGTYDSPTFLGKRDVYLLGLTMPQIAASGGIAVAWLLLAMMFNITMQMRLIVFGPMYLFTLAMVFVKPFGLMLPILALLWLKYLFVKPTYESDPVQLIDGHLERLPASADAVGLKAKLRKLLPFMRKVSKDDAFEARTSEAKAEASKQADEMMRNAHTGVLDLLKSLWKG